MIIRKVLTLFYTLFFTLLAVQALAEEAIGVSKPWQMGFREAASPVMERIVDFHNFLMIISVAIALFVTILLGYVMFRFRASKNPNPSKRTHNTFIEVLWTVIPIIILVVMVVPSFRLLYYMDKTDEPEMTLKAIGHQWYWSYEYPDHGDFVFDAIMIEESDLKPGQERLLHTDNEVVLPINTNIKILVTANDVIHNWALPSFGIKMDAVPGQLNETWVNITKPGIYYGMCSELCGVRHSFMPITIRAVTKENFSEWVEKAKVEFAKSSPQPSDIHPKFSSEFVSLTSNIKNKVLTK
ncbi:MAG: cytochrome c oxidase subunit 2 [Alphaproteobacteria bacterium MarineAlpha2_Bin1]|nr:MAG: cytochrome c oxidase subunit 2 [Alphaproteobacteria bacterium MarineAlpha2_Bin1]